ncbi:preprotein translocase subunit SecG [bacterium]|nr:preprotein translocase subunit SecG [bacterium]
MLYFLYGLHFIVCVAIIIVVLLQADKGSGLSGAFGGGGSYAKFGDDGGWNFMSKATTFVAVLFMVLSLVISIHTKHTYNAGVKAGITNTQEKPSDAMEKALQKTVVETQANDKAVQAGTTDPKPVTAPVKPVTAPAPVETPDPKGTGTK